MPRIRKYHSDKNESDNNNDADNKRVSIKKTEDIPLDLSDEKKETEKASQSFDREDISGELLKLFGEKLFESLRNNKDINPGFSSEEEIKSAQEWLQKLLDTYLSDEEIRLIGKNISDKIREQENSLKEAKSENEALKNKVEKIESEFSEIEEETDKLFAENKELRILSDRRIEFSEVLEAVFTANNQESIKNLLSEAVNNYPGKETNNFILAFIKGWMRLSVTIPLAFASEKEENYIELFDDALRNLLESIKDKSIPQRRALLDAVAKYVSAQFKEFEFVSPEESSQIDLNIHNAQGTGGNKIKQGISFAVLFKKTRKTYKYADIEVI